MGSAAALVVERIVAPVAVGAAVVVDAEVE